MWLVTSCSLTSSVAVHRVRHCTPRIYDPWIFPWLNTSTETRCSFKSQSSTGGRCVTESYCCTACVLLSACRCPSLWRSCCSHCREWDAGISLSPGAVQKAQQLNLWTHTPTPFFAMRAQWWNFSTCCRITGLKKCHLHYHTKENPE